MKKTPGDIIILHMCTKNYDQIDDVQFLRYGVRWTDGWKKRHTEVGSPPKNDLDRKTCLISISEFFSQFKLNQNKKKLMQWISKLIKSKTYNIKLPSKNLHIKCQYSYRCQPGY